MCFVKYLTVPFSVGLPAKIGNPVSRHPNTISTIPCHQGRIQRGGAIALLKPTKVALFTMIVYNSENNVHDYRPFCRPLFCHSSVCEVYFISLQQRRR